ncbi:MAG: aldehyde dehydrogenase family protein [Chloroflexi bacterium]|nr:aldehyde dehydrogenase family protein [Chloroflexota bacterium]
MSKEQGFFLAGEWRTSDSRLEVRHPYDGSLVGATFWASEKDLEEATQKAVKAFEVTRKLTSHQRFLALRKLLGLLQQQEDRFTRLIVQEAGKPWKQAKAEVNRAFLTIEIAAEESRRIGGELLPMDVAPNSAGLTGIVGRFPIGPIAGISPFNFPLNLALHKICPAIASGNPILVKPSPRTPLTLLALAELIAQLDLPAGAVSIMPFSNELAAKMVADDRFKMLTFTGSAPVGWDLKARAGKKRVLLELGGNAAVIVDRDTDLDAAIPRIVVGGYGFAGQSCISVQRVYVHQDIYDEFSHRLVHGVQALKVGDPMSENTDVGPVIDEAAAKRTEAWCREAVSEGAQVLTGGRIIRGNLFEPTVLDKVRPTSKVCNEEVFAPVVVLAPFTDFRKAVAAVNDSRYGLQAGVYTNNLEHVLYAFQELQVGGIMINEIPSFRIDHMPYGGTKDSGLGREGLRYAIEEMTEPRLLVIRRQT